MTVKEFYAEYGAYDEIIKRLMKDTLVLKFVKKFPGDPSFSELTSALDDGNEKNAFRAAHSLKGVCKNLAFSSLADSASEITELLRGENCDIHAAKALYPKVKADYDAVISGISILDA